MIAPGITLQQVDEIYQRMGLKELFVLPWFEDGKLVGLITGDIEVIPGFGKQGFLERIIVLPEAKHKLHVMHQMPHAAAGLAMAAGCRRVTLCIGHNDPRRKRLEAWAVRCGYTFEQNHDNRAWYVLDLSEETNNG